MRDQSQPELRCREASEGTRTGHLNISLRSVDCEMARTNCMRHLSTTKFSHCGVDHASLAPGLL